MGEQAFIYSRNTNN